MHWEQNQNIAFYPTSIERQLHLGPLAEMVILNFQILAGNDRLANFVQFFAMIGCVVGASFITKKMGGNVYAQVFASISVATLPMGILQSTSTQTDYVVALWLVSFVSLVLEQMQAKKTSRMQYFLIGASLGLAILTKVTVLLFGASFGLWFAAVVIKRFSISGWKEVIILLGVALIILAPHTTRNYDLYKGPFGPMTETGQVQYKYTNDSYNFPAFASNSLRNIAIHLAVPFENINNGTEKIISRLHTILKTDINDPKTTWAGVNFSVNYSTHEDLAGNPFHFFLIVVSTILLTFVKNRQAALYSLCLLFGFILFSFFLKWQPWHGRLHFPLFILAIPIIGVAFSSGVWRQLFYAIFFLITLFALNNIFQNPSRPFLGEKNIFKKERTAQYFASRPDYFRMYEKQAETVNALQCNDIGLMTGIDDWEYPIWVMTKAYGKDDIHFEHLLVDNPSGMLTTDFSPCAILSTYLLQEEIITYQGKEYAKVRDEKQLSLFVLSDVQR